MLSWSLAPLRSERWGYSMQALFFSSYSGTTYRGTAHSGNCIQRKALFFSAYSGNRIQRRSRCLQCCHASVASIRRNSTCELSWAGLRSALPRLRGFAENQNAVFSILRLIDFRGEIIRFEGWTKFEAAQAGLLQLRSQRDFCRPCCASSVFFLKMFSSPFLLRGDVLSRRSCPKLRQRYAAVACGGRRQIHEGS